MGIRFLICSFGNIKQMRTGTRELSCCCFRCCFRCRCRCRFHCYCGWYPVNTFLRNGEMISPVPYNARLVILNTRVLIVPFSQTIEDGMPNRNADESAHELSCICIWCDSTMVGRNLYLQQPAVGWEEGDGGQCNGWDSNPHAPHLLHRKTVVCHRATSRRPLPFEITAPRLMLGKIEECFFRSLELNGLHCVLTNTRTIKPFVCVPGSSVFREDSSATGDLLLYHKPIRHAALDNLF